MALLYLGLGLTVAIVAGWIVGRLKMEAHLEDWVRAMPRTSAQFEGAELTLGDRIQAGFSAVREIVGKVWPYILAGIAIGAGCADCKNAIALIDQAAKAKGLDVTLTKVEDLQDSMSYGVMSTPGVLINGKVVHAGDVPRRDKIAPWLTAV